MLILSLIGCFAHKASLTGVIDYVDDKNCTVILDNNDMIIINSKFCNNSKEGDVIYIYVKKQ